MEERSGVIVNCVDTRSLGVSGPLVEGNNLSQWGKLGATLKCLAN